MRKWHDDPRVQFVAVVIVQVVGMAVLLLDLIIWRP